MVSGGAGAIMRVTSEFRANKYAGTMRCMMISMAASHCALAALVPTPCWRRTFLPRRHRAKACGRDQSVQLGASSGGGRTPLVD